MSAAPARLERRQAFEIRARDVVQLERETECSSRERVRQMIDGVVGHGQRAVAAGVGDGELEIGIQLSRSLDFDV